MIESRCPTPSHSWLVPLLLLSSALAMPSPTSQDRGGDSALLVKLWAAFEGERPVEGRLAGGLAYAAYDTENKRSTSQPPLNPAFYKTARVASEILEAAEKSPTAESLHAAGVLHLFWRQPADAILRLESARAMAPNDAAILSDLSLAYFARARLDNEPYDFIDALEVS